MEDQVKFPDLGEGVESATVSTVLVSEGDRIEIDQALCELETDKAVAEVPSPKAGRVKKIHVQADQEVKPGDLMLTLESDEGDSEDEQKDRDEGQSEEKPAGEEPPKKDDSGKPQSRPEKKSQKKPGKKAETDQASKDAEEPAAEAEEEAEEEARESAEAAESRSSQMFHTDVPAAPAVRRLARELGVDLARVEGSGEGGWIREADVKAAARQSTGRKGEGSASGDRDDWGAVRREKLSGTRKTIARRMAESHGTYAAATHFDEADVTELEAFRQKSKTALGEGETAPGLLAYVARAVVEGLKRHPKLNATLDLDAGEVVYKDYYHLGIAVDSDRGLMVPVLRDAGCMGIAELHEGIAALVEAVRAGKVQGEQMQGGSFTISNLGSVGGRFATPVINPPQSAILLTGRAREAAGVADGQVAVRTLLPLSLTYDHRLIDGADAQRFLEELKRRLESPERLLTG
jgi:pyruvate/2-oxoglutarate dehydrogenase complex dihydrolipoamide acyltransferase (E2) component